ncbi:hypothetical protein NB688_001362 [Xanthomonas sacchari]|uniref:DUF4870 domain-containing protein n=1 Tax=Xanthomonas sacchari TaxID=56458 RepID=A0ABT3DRU6_9XANT|nr:DUF4870 domain-containing protein [Xanthomonas sacchari]MCW0398207.1 hypothetical protein [Xanthomonas sacchari]MCW0419196.1 hypothetical protein [Xanthomonas sacchari]UYK71482.1 DUF4870 domain-containing protein [Xanthomonas sacchari]
MQASDTENTITDGPAPAWERALAAFAHLSMWIGLFATCNAHLGDALWWLLLLWLLPGAQWWAMRGRQPFVAEHARQAMRMGFGLSLLSAVLLAPSVLIFGAVLVFGWLLVLMLLVAMGVSLYAAAKAMLGRR